MVSMLKDKQWSRPPLQLTQRSCGVSETPTIFSNSFSQTWDQRELEDVGGFFEDREGSSEHHGRVGTRGQDQGGLKPSGSGE